MDNSLDDILNENSTSEATETEATTEDAATEDKAADDVEAKVEEKSDTDKSEDKDAEDKPDEKAPDEGKGDDEAATPAAKDDAKTVPLAALKDERSKRQDLERQLADATGKKDAPKRPDALEDPEGSAKFMEGEVDKKVQNIKVDMSYQMASQFHDDFDQVMEAWPGLAEQSPGIYEQALNDAMPGEFAYQACKRHLMLKDIGDPAEYEQRIRADERAKVEAEAKAAGKAKKTVPNLPESLASEPGGSRGGPGWVGPRSIEDVINQ